MNDERLAHEIHAALSAREPGPVPASLRARVAAIPLTTRANRWPSLSDVLRGGLRLAAVTAAVALVVAIGDYAIARPAPGAGTAPDATIERVPFVVDGGGLFSTAAVADADHRLESVFRATGLEATLVTQHEAADNQLSTPEGFPELYDRDGSADRDIVQVIGIDPSGTISCCVSASGAVVDRAIADFAWPPLTQPTDLTAGFSSPTVAGRDAALDRFVGGVERASGRIDEVVESIRTGDAVRSGAIGGLVGAIVLVTVWLMRGRPVPTFRGSPVGSGAAGDLVFEDLSAGAGSEAQSVEPAVEPAATLRSSTRVSWRAHVIELGLGAAAVAAFGAFLVQGLVLAPARAASRPVDLSATGFGVATIAPPIVTLSFLIATVLLLLVLSTRLGRAGWALISLIIVGAIAFTLVVANEEPRLGSGSSTGLGFGIRESGGPQGVFDVDYYPVREGEPFTFTITVRNPGPLPMTVLGLSSSFSKPGPGFVPGLEIVGLGTRSGSIMSGSAAGAEVFQPVRLNEDEEVQLLVVGRGGTCAAGSLEAGESVAILTHLPIAYSVLGSSRVVDVGLPSSVMVPTLVASCVS